MSKPLDVSNVEAGGMKPAELVELEEPVEKLVHKVLMDKICLSQNISNKLLRVNKFTNQHFWRKIHKNKHIKG